MTDNRVPLTMCWHCDRPLDGATSFGEDGAQRALSPIEGAISLCLYCGAVGVFGPDLRLLQPPKSLLDVLEEDREFMLKYLKFAWARQYVMINASLMRERENPDR